jgi:hypothetical protein
MLGIGWYYGRAPLENSIDQIAVQAAAGQNQELSALAARYLILNGTVNSQEDNKPVAEAIVFASKDQAVREVSRCQEPECTFRKTYTNGEFSIDLTRIKVEKEDQITLTVVKDGYETVSEPLRVDVRAMDVSVAPQTVKLPPAVQAPPTPGTPQS